MSDKSPKGWQTHRLGEMCDVCRGSSPRPIADPRYFDGGTIPWIKIADATKSGKYLYTTKEHVNEFGASFSRLLPRGSLIIAASGTLGYPQFLGVEGCAHDGWLIPSNYRGLDRHFLYYLFLWKKEFFYSSAYGAAIQNINTMILREMEITVPSLPTQCKIASILSAYDDLIDNNTRRIAILEAVAHAIYREWFVEFRFPGHEKVKLVDSSLGKIPEGWKVSTLEGACQSVIDGDWIETKDQGGADYRLLQVSNIGTGCFVETGNFRYVTQETFDRLRCQEVKPGHILISRMPKPIGRGWLVTAMPWKMITAVDVAIATAHPDRATGHFLVNYLNSPEHIDNAEKHATGTTRPRISRSVLSGLQFVLPPLPLQQRFTAVVADGYSLTTALTKTIDVLRTTRDLVLPRLISGQMAVEDINIEVGEAVTE